MYQSESNPQLD